MPYQVTKKKRKTSLRNTHHRENEQEIEARENNRLALAKSIKGVVAEFPPKVGQVNEDSVTKVGLLSKIMVELKKQVEELESKHVPSTTHEVLEEQSKATFEAVARISKGEKLYTKTVEAISAISKGILEDETREKIKENAWQYDEKITVAKAEMKKLLLKEKVTKMAEIK